MDPDDVPAIERRIRALLFAGLLLSIGLPLHGAEIEELDRIVAVVDEDVIVSSELNAEMIKVINELRQRS